MRDQIKKRIPYFLGKYLEILYFFAPSKALRKAFVLFCTPRKGEVLEEHEYFLDEGDDEIIAFNDIEIQTYRWPGMGDTVLMLHGWESNTNRWKIMIRKLHKLGYNVVAFDAPAHGYSSGKLLNIPLYTECLQKIIELYRPNHIVGHSIGGASLLFNQFKYPNPEIEKLVILGAPSELSRIVEGFKNTLQLSQKFIDALNLYFKDKFGYYFEEFSVAQFTNSINTPGLIIHDLLDQVAPFSEGKSIHEQWQNSELISTKNLGHSMVSREVNQMIIDYLKK